MNNDFDKFDLDKHRLDEEWCNQPRLYHEAADQLADARKEVEISKAAKDLCEAELDRKIRTHPDEFGLPEKTTETMIRNVLIVQQRYQDCVNKMIDTKHQVDLIESDVRSLEHRKSALENLVSLRMKDYYADPVAAPEVKERMEKVSMDNAFEGKKKKRAESDTR